MRNFGPGNRILQLIVRHPQDVEEADLQDADVVVIDYSRRLA